VSLLKHNRERLKRDLKREATLIPKILEDQGVGEVVLDRYVHHQNNNIVCDINNIYI
jgi:hypothetical protein